MKLFYWLLFFTFISSSIFAQVHYNDLPIEAKIRIKEGSSTYFTAAKLGLGNPPSIMSSPEQDCNSAIPVCQNVYSTSVSYSGVGNSDEIPSNSCLGSNEKNSVWYTFSTSSAGNLAFNITPNSMSDDYDFALYDITGNNCSAIASGAITPIRCNFSATSGVTGLSSSGSNASEPASGSNQSTVLATTPGRTYVLVISNYSSTQSGYTLDFSPGTASIFDNIAPAISGVTAPCGSSSITFNASEQIQCSSIAANASDFTVTGTGGPYTVTSAIGVNCGINTAQITLAISPALSGIGPWTVGVITGSDGNTLIDACGNTMTPQTQTFTTVPPAAVISGPTSVCKNVVFALTASSAISYTWTGVGVPAGQQNQQSISVTPSVSGTMNFTLTVNNGSCGNSSVSHAVTVKEGISAHFTVSSQTICAGQTANFTNTSAVPNTCLGLGLTPCTSSCGFLQPCQTTALNNANILHTWSYGDPLSGGNNFDTSVDGSHTYNTPGTYYVNLSSNFILAGNNCGTSETHTILVLPATVNLTVSATNSICPGQTATLTASGGSSYTWTPITTVTSPNSGTTTANPTITTTYSVSSPGCSGTQTNTVQVVVGGNPPAIGAISGSTNICPSSTAVIYSVTNIASTNYTWSVPAGATITSTPTNSNIITVDFGANGGTISVTAAGTCGTSTASVNVILNPNLTLTVTPDNSSICAGGSVTLTASGANDYTWTPSNSLDISTGSIVVASPTTTTTYTVIGATGTCTGSATATVTMNSALTLTLSSNTSTVCPGGSALLDAIGATNYTWSPSSSLSSANGSNVTASPLANTSYTVLGSTGTCTGVATISVGIGACVSSSCNISSIRTALTNAGNVELLGMNNSCSLYFINPQIMTGPQAQAYAQSFGANLISIQSAAENSDVVQALANQGFASNVVWIGFGDSNNEGTFTWYDGAPITYSNWAAGEPNNAGDEDCTQIYPDGGWNDLNCSGYNSISIIEVNICPQVTINPVPIHCPSTDVTLTASTLLGSPNYTYTWVQSGTETYTNTSSPGNTDQITVTSLGANTFTVFSEDRYSCPQSAVISLSVYATPTITATNATICAGQETATLTASGASTYSWIPGTGLSSTTGSVVTGTPSSSQNYTVIGMDANGCINGTITAITVNPLPTINVSSNVTICPSNSTTLTASGSTSYTWSPSSTLSSPNGSIVTASPSVSTIYTVQGSLGNCIGTNTTSVYIAGNGFPPNVYIIQKNSLCDTNVLNWLNITSVTPVLAQGSLPSGLTVNATHSGGGMSTTPSMFSGGTFPATYSVPIASTTIRNDLGGTFNFCFNQPVINPQIAFASIGQGGLPITINTSVPYQVLWTGINMTYVNANSMIGAEGFTIIRFPGIHTCISLDYIGDESYCNLAFGVMDTDCQDQPICPGQSVELIGNGAATYTWNTGAVTSTIVPTPTITSTYSVIGTTSDGCTNTATTTIVVLPTPTISVNSTSICVGQQTATLTANGASTFTWAPTTNLSAATGATVTGTPSVTQTYSVTGTDTNGCLGETTTTITVSPLPIITANSPTICIGQQTATVTANGATTYSWIPGTDLSATTGSVVTGTPSSTQNYTVVGIDANGCINGTITTIVVNTLPTITVNNASICIGQQTATLTANGADTYTWSPNSDLSSNTGSVVIGTPTITQNYTVTGTDVNGCISNASSTITVNPLPIISSNDASICIGQQTATLIANGAATYSWTPGTSLSATTGSLVTGTPTVSQNYTVTGIDINGCINNTITAITVNQLPSLIASPNETVCPLSTNTLSVSGANSYTWSPNTDLNTVFGSSVICTPSVTTTYTIDATSVETCTNTTTLTIVVNNTVVVSASATTSTICPLGSTSLIASGATSYTWNPALSLNSATGTTVTSTPSSTETYTVIGATSTCTNSTMIVVTVTTNPVISISSSPSVICSGSQSNLTASGAVSYTWLPTNNLSNATGFSVTANPNITETYTISGTSTLGCLGTTTTTLTVIPTPTISVSANPISFCSGLSTTLSAMGATDYTWSPGGSVADINFSSTEATPILSTTYTALGTNGTPPFLCSSSNTIEITVIPNTTVTPSPNVPICEGQSTKIYANGATNYTWTPSVGINNPYTSMINVSPSSATIYTVTGLKAGFCPGTATVQVDVIPLPFVDAGKDTTINIDESVELHGIASSPAGFTANSDYQISCNFCSDIVVNPSVSTCFILTSTTNTLPRCSNSDTVCVFITTEWGVYIPNTFTPNNDGINDIFTPVGYAIEDLSMEIYDRWGLLIFKSSDTQKGWDGTVKGAKGAQGVYIYRVEIKTMGGEHVQKVGHVNLIN